MSDAALSVLAVDDELPQLEDLARLLRANRRVSDVETAATAHDAVIKARERGYDAVFLDVRMPELAAARLTEEFAESAPDRDSSDARDVIAVHDLRARGMRLLARSSIFYVSAYGHYVRVYADSGRYLLRSSLTDVERRFAGHGFLRVHRQYLVNLTRAVEIRAQLNGTAVTRFENGGEIPVAPRHVPELRRRVRK